MTIAQYNKVVTQDDDLTMEDMACVNRWLSTLEKSIDVTWGVGRTAKSFPPFQIIVITTSAPI